jgi:hypothetical protein
MQKRKECVRVFIGKLQVINFKLLHMYINVLLKILVVFFVYLTVFSIAFVI